MLMYISYNKLQGAVAVPPSKSFSIRALAADYLAKGGSTVHNLSDCEDVVAAQKAFSSMANAKMRWERGGWSNMALEDLYEEVVVDCGESALTLHLAAALAALHDGSVSFTAQGSLISRPLHSLLSACEVFGVRCSLSEMGFPLQIIGPLRPGKGVLDGQWGSQAVSGLLMALPLLDEESEIMLHHPVSLPYINLTLEVMRRFGVEVEVLPDVQSGAFRYLIPGGQRYRPSDVTVPGDWSAAAVLMTAAAVSSAKYGGQKCVVLGVGAPNAAAPDSVIIQALRAAGVSCTYSSMATDCSKSSFVEGWEIGVFGDLRPFVFDLTDAPDLAPPLTALAASIPGVSILKGAGRLKGKESSRGEALQQVFKQMGIEIELSQDKMMVHGKKNFAPCSPSEVLHCHNDHRIAMAIAIAAVGSDTPLFLLGSSCVAKTYPRFWDDLASLSL